MSLYHFKYCFLENGKAFVDFVLTGFSIVDDGIVKIL
jgi:hypothetical protein